MPLSLDAFQTRLADSQLISANELRALLEGLAADQRPSDGEQLARLLVAQKRLTAYQAQRVYQGQTQDLVLGNYVVLDKLGQGGMGAVYKAEHRRMKRVVAIKVVAPEFVKTPDALKRFQREVEAAARLDHPNIVAAYDADQAGRTHFLVMQFVDGTDLSSHVKRQGPLTLSAAVDCVLQAARGLEYAHSQGVVHRDIKPGNLLIDKQGRVRVLDMGLARLDSLAGGDDVLGLTTTGAMMGTVDYMSPEQGFDTKHADHRADIYSLGCTLYFLLTRRPMYGGDSILQKLLNHREAPIPSLAQSVKARPDCREYADLLLRVDGVFRTMVAKRAGDRYPSMTAVIAALEQCRTPGGTSVRLPGAASEESRLSEFLQFLESRTTPATGTASEPPVTVPEGPARTLTAPDGTIGDAAPSRVRSAAQAAETMPVSLRRRPRWHWPALGVVAALALLAVFTGPWLGSPAGETPDTESDADDGLGHAPDQSTRTKAGEGRASPIAALPARTPDSAGPQYALDFSPDTDRGRTYVEFPPLPLRQGEPLTVEVWAAPRSRPVAGISRYVWSLAGRLELRQTADAWAWSSWDGDRVDLIRFEDGVQLNHPVHLAGVSTGQELLFFVAGRLVGRQAITAQVGDSDQVPGMGGSKHDVKHYQSFDGTIHSLRISSAARYLLSFDPPAQFQTDRDTLAVYLFGEGTGDVLRDSSGHGRHGAIAGARWVELRSPLDHGITNRVRESGETVP